MPTGYEVGTHRNIDGIRRALERIADALEKQAEAQPRVDRLSGAAERPSAEAPENVRR